MNQPLTGALLIRSFLPMRSSMRWKPRRSVRRSVHDVCQAAPDTMQYLWRRYVPPGMRFLSPALMALAITPKEHSAAKDLIAGATCCRRWFYSAPSVWTTRLQAENESATAKAAAYRPASPYLHAHPESAFEEQNTSRFLLPKSSKLWALEVHRDIGKNRGGGEIEMRRRKGVIAIRAISMPFN